MPAKVSLRKLMDQVAVASSLEAVYESALRCLRETLEIERVAMLVLDARDVMRFVAWSGLSDPYRRAVEGHSPWPAGADDAAPVLVEDVERHTELDALRPVIEHEGMRALALVPLRFGTKLLGEFMLCYGRPHRFSSDEVSITETIAGHVASVLEHHRIEAELERRLETAQRARRDAECEAELRLERERRLRA